MEKAIRNEESFGLIMALTDLACYDMPDLAKQFTRLKNECLCNDVLDENKRVPFARRIKQLISDSGNGEKKCSDNIIPTGTNNGEEFAIEKEEGYTWVGVPMGFECSTLTWFCSSKATKVVKFENGWMITETLFVDDRHVDKIAVEIVD